MSYCIFLPKVADVHSNWKYLFYRVKIWKIFVLLRKDMKSNILSNYVHKVAWKLIRIYLGSFIHRSAVLQFFLTTFDRTLCSFSIDPPFKTSHNISLRKRCHYSEIFWSAFSSHFRAFGLNTKRYGLSVRIQSECGKNADQNNSEYGHFTQCMFLKYYRWENMKAWKVRKHNYFQSASYNLFLKQSTFERVSPFPNECCIWHSISYYVSR